MSYFHQLTKFTLAQYFKQETIILAPTSSLQREQTGLH